MPPIHIPDWEQPPDTAILSWTITEDANSPQVLWMTLVLKPHVQPPEATDDSAITVRKPKRTQKTTDEFIAIIKKTQENLKRAKASLIAQPTDSPEVPP